MLPALAASRLTLRMLRDDDVPALFAIFGDTGAMKYFGMPALKDAGGARRLLCDIRRFAESGTLFQWGIARNAGDAVIGTATLHHMDAPNRRAEIGFAVARDQWGRGYATEAVARLIRHAFDDLGMHRLEADPDPRNAASIRVLEKLGFKYEGLLRERYFHDGEPQDAAYYGLLRQERRAGTLSEANGKTQT